MNTSCFYGTFYGNTACPTKTIRGRTACETHRESRLLELSREVEHAKREAQRLEAEYHVFLAEGYETRSI